MLVGGPDAPGLPGGADVQIADAYRQIVNEWDGRAFGRVRYADAAGTVTGPDHAFVRPPAVRAPTRARARGATAARCAVRSPDRAHFCPAEGAYLRLSGPVAGRARASASEMARVAREALDDLTDSGHRR